MDLKLTKDDCTPDFLAEVFRMSEPPADYHTTLAWMSAAQLAGMDYTVLDGYLQRGVGYNQAENLSMWRGGLNKDEAQTLGFVANLAKAAGVDLPAYTRMKEGKAQESHGNPQNKPTDERKPTTPTGTGAEEEAPKFESFIANWKAKAKKAAELAKAKAEAAKVIEDAQVNPTPAFDYLAGRGISKETCIEFGIGYDPKADAVVIPYSGDYYVMRFRYAAPNGAGLPRYRFAAGQTTPIFNSKRLFDGSDLVFCTEGQIDAMTIEQCGYPCIACKDEKPLADALDDRKRTARAFIYIADKDEAGAKYAKKVMMVAYAKGLTADIVELPEGYHDSNDFWMRDPEGLKAFLKATKEIYENASAEQLAEYAKKTTLDGFGDELLEIIRAGQPLLKTGFPLLDKRLNGGLARELVIIGAQSSMGKTTYCVQLAEQIAELNDKDILYVALEQDEKELSIKAINRHLLMDSKVELSAKDILYNYKLLNSQNKALIVNTFKDYRAKYGKQIYFHSERGTNIDYRTIEGFVKKHKQMTGKTPVVFVDYLQILGTGEPMRTKDGTPLPDHRSDREILEANIKGLSAITRDYGTTVILISAFNRASSNANADFTAFKGTGNIEFSADVLLGLQADIIYLRKHFYEDNFGFIDAYGNKVYFKQQGKDEVIDTKAFKSVFNEVEGRDRAGVMPMGLEVMKIRLSPPGEPIAFCYKPKCDAFVNAQYDDATFGQSAFYPGTGRLDNDPDPLRYTKAEKARIEKGNAQQQQLNQAASEAYQANAQTPKYQAAKAKALKAAGQHTKGFDAECQCAEDDSCI